MRVKATSILFAVFLLSISNTCLAEETIELGDSADKVLKVLGKPRGKMKKGKSEYWSYSRGLVKIREDKVSYLNIYSQEEAAEKEARRAALIKSRQDSARQAAEAKAKSIKEGTAKRTEKLADEEFLKLSKEEQLKYWQGFASQYPDVDVSDEINALEKEIAPVVEEPEQSEREILLETIEAKQQELDDWIQKAKTTSAGRTWARKYHLARNKLEAELIVLREELRAMPKE